MRFLWVFALMMSSCLSSVRGSTTGASATGGASTSGAGGCYSNVAARQFDPCDETGRCGCPFVCVDDPFSATLSVLPTGGHICEAACQSNDDCELLTTACIGGRCAAVACGGDGGNGHYNGVCLMGDGAAPSRGTCQLAWFADGGFVATCVEGGTAEGDCNFWAVSRLQESEVCPAGAVCGESVLGSQCWDVCDIAVGCPDGGECRLFGTTPETGNCGPKL